jgi:hypothetical protein
VHPLYNEVNKKLILSRDVIFHKSTKKDKAVERHLDHLDIFTHVMTYHKLDNEIPHLEGGISILGQSSESPFEVPSPPQVEDPTTHLNMMFNWMM